MVNYVRCSNLRCRLKAFGESCGRGRCPIRRGDVAPGRVIRGVTLLAQSGQYGRSIPYYIPRFVSIAMVAAKAGPLKSGIASDQFIAHCRFRAIASPPGRNRARLGGTPRGMRSWRCFL